jgi:hypothetical protein
MTFESLRTRYLTDTAGGGPGASPALARALERIGWRAVREPTPEELAGELAELLDVCVHGHRNVAELEYGIAATLRACGPVLDGGLPPVEAYQPAAADLLRLYVRNDRAPMTPMSDPTFDPFA